MKRAISVVLSLILIIGLIPVCSSAAAEKEGYSLEPTLYGKNGVDVRSAFILTTPESTSLSDVSAMLSIDGEPLPVISQNSKTEFLITPETPLLNNSLYIFRLSHSGKEDITWAFQTAVKFEITSSLPVSQSTNIPVNSGIEITFSSDGYSRLDSHFSINPSVKGRLEYHDETAVFVPEALEYKTVYTVTVKAGIKQDGTGEKLESDFVFSFETEEKPDEKNNNTSRQNSVYFYSGYVELPSTQAPEIKFYAYKGENSAANDPEINVYKFGSSKHAIAAVRKRLSVPGWSRFAKAESFCDVSLLEKVLSFSVDLSSVNDNILTLPDKLSPGFYLIDADFGGSYDQLIIQISDIPVQVVADSDRIIVWVNSITTGKGVSNAEVYDAVSGKIYKTDKNGLAVIDRTLDMNGGEQFDITAPDGSKCTWIYEPGYYYGASSSSSEAYWKYLQLDRTLFQRDDSVFFWGFVQSRDGDEDIKNVTAILTQGYSYYGTRDILQKQTVAVQNDAYSDEIKLPNLDAGTYCLSVYHGDILLSSIYFSVQDYVKPPYTLEVAADKKAIFAEEAVNFSVKAAFFEGTAVPGLDISYSTHSYSLDNSAGNLVTDTKGKAAVEIPALPVNSVTQGQTSLTFYAEATLPEIGPTMASESVRVFINDIIVDTKASRTDKNATLNVSVNAVDLDRLNNGTECDYYDYLGEPSKDVTLSAEIYRCYWTKLQDGSYYDYIEKKSIPTYRYVRNEELIDQFSLVTGNDGSAEKQFTVPDRDGESYYARLICKDGNGREIISSAFIGRDYSSYYQTASGNHCYLDASAAIVNTGETVQLTLKRGTDTVKKGNFLFVAMQRGITGFQAGENPYSFTFSEKDVPNVYIYAYYFNGYSYESGYNMVKNICYNCEESGLTLRVTTDKESYSPGDTCTVSVTAEDKNGAAAGANINVSIVDEALFALRDYSVDTLASLYRGVSSGLKLAASTHRAYIYDSEEITEFAPLADAESDSSDSNDLYLREFFKDTAFFGTVLTDKHGKAAFTFTMPDNITSWRLTVSGISGGLSAGNSVQNISVTSPMFISYTLNDTFLTGDTPVIGVNAYGAGLTAGETVQFEVWDESAPDVKYTAASAAFERVNIPLWEMSGEGKHALIIKAAASGKNSDMVRHEYTVLSTYRQIDTAHYYDVTTETVFEAGSGGLTNITFTDKSRGQYLYQLLSMRYLYGDRIEKLVVRRQANALLAKYFPDLPLYDYEDSFEPMDYQKADGGIAILPYAGSNVETTVKLMKYIKDDVNINSLKRYLYDIYYGSNSENKMCALYGLAQLKEPVLLELNAFAKLENIETKDAIYVALGYCALGEMQAAEGIYDTLIGPSLEYIRPYYRVKAGTGSDDILEASSAANMLASALGKPEREGLYRYCINNHTQDVLIEAEKLAYIEAEIEKAVNESGSITYSLFGDKYTIELKNGGCYTLKIPAVSMKEFKLIEVTGNVGAVSSYKTPLAETAASDNGITVRRRYYEANEYEHSSETFNQGDIVRVQIWIEYSETDPEGSYSVTDYLPSGLEYVSYSAKIGGSSGFGRGYSRYVTVEGQKITFFDYNRKSGGGCLYYYYARVINPGSFRAEGALVQNLTAKGYMSIGRDDLIIINNNNS